MGLAPGAELCYFGTKKTQGRLCVRVLPLCHKRPFPHVESCPPPAKRETAPRIKLAHASACLPLHNLPLSSTAVLLHPTAPALATLLSSGTRKPPPPSPSSVPHNAPSHPARKNSLPRHRQRHHLPARDGRPAHAARGWLVLRSAPRAHHVLLKRSAPPPSQSDEAQGLCTTPDSASVNRRVYGDGPPAGHVGRHHGPHRHQGGRPATRQVAPQARPAFPSLVPLVLLRRGRCRPGSPRDFNGRVTARRVETSCAVRIFNLGALLRSLLAHGRVDAFILFCRTSLYIFIYVLGYPAPPTLRYTRIVR